MADLNNRFSSVCFGLVLVSVRFRRGALGEWATR
jgi:hypothetical protein